MYKWYFSHDADPGRNLALHILAPGCPAKITRSSRHGCENCSGRGVGSSAIDEAAADGAVEERRREPARLSSRVLSRGNSNSFFLATAWEQRAEPEAEVAGPEDFPSSLGQVGELPAGKYHGCNHRAEFENNQFGQCLCLRDNNNSFDWPSRQRNEFYDK